MEGDSHIPYCTISIIVNRTCAAIYQVLHEKYLRTPNNSREWKLIADKFLEKWQLPHCLGAIDGKYVEITKPPNIGSKFFNYKHYFSTVLLAVSDADCRCIYADFGSSGHNHDAGIFATSDFYKALQQKSLDIPNVEHLPGSETYSPYFLLVTQYFPSENFTWSSTCKNFSGILTSKWRIFHRPIETSLEHAIDAVKAAVCLHNFLIDEMPQNGNPKSLADTGDSSHGRWRQLGSRLDNAQMVSRGANRPTETAKEVRENLKNWFHNEGAAV